MRKDPFLALLEESGEPLTRENYLNLAFLGNPPSRLDPEEEEQMPQAFQTQTRDQAVARNEKVSKMKDKLANDKAKAAEEAKKSLLDKAMESSKGKKPEKEEKPAKLVNPNPAIGGVNKQMNDVQNPDIYLGTSNPNSIENRAKGYVSPDVEDRRHEHDSDLNNDLSNLNILK